jgi:aspartate-semialdehyde dehydrogenase
MYKIAVVGATGLVGQKMLQILAERNFPISELIPVASESSIGKEIEYLNQKIKVVSANEAIDKKPQIAIFSAGSGVSLEFAPKFAAIGCFVIDNSSAWRMQEDKKLIVPEINAAILTKNDKIIANPNCSTIQMVMALAPLHHKYKIKRIVVSTYQSVTGTGIKAVNQLIQERENNRKGDKILPFGEEKGGVEMAYKYPIDMNIIPQIDLFTENGYTKEEMKMINETRKILNDNSIQITATTVRIPVMGGHSESVNVAFENNFEEKELIEILTKTEGIVVFDDISKQEYPMPLYAHDKDEVFVGRIRRDFSQPKTLNMWIVADNLRKGAATNAVQIAEYLVTNKLLE